MATLGLLHTAELRQITGAHDVAVNDKLGAHLAVVSIMADIRPMQGRRQCLLRAKGALPALQVSE